MFEDTALAGGGRLDASLSVDEERRVIGWLWWSGRGIGGWGDTNDDDEFAFGMINAQYLLHERSIYLFNNNIYRGLLNNNSIRFLYQPNRLNFF